MRATYEFLATWLRARYGEAEDQASQRTTVPHPENPAARDRGEITTSDTPPRN